MISKTELIQGCSRGAIQKQARLKDLNKAVRQSAYAKLIFEDAKVAGVVAGCNAKSATDTAADRKVDVVICHRNNVQRLRELEETIIRNSGL